MALEANLLQGSYSTFLSATSPSSRGSKFKHLVPISHAVRRKGRLISLEYKSYSSVEAPLVYGPKSELSRISAFKGCSRHDDSGGRASVSSHSLKKHVKVSYLQHESEESFVEPSQVQNIVPDPCTSADETITRSLALRNLFKNWLVLLRTPPQTQPAEVLEESSSTDSSEVPKIVQEIERGSALKSLCCYLLGCNATLKLPFLIFLPLYLVVNLIYGPEVSKELAPLWILGPLVVVLYVKMFRAICRLYVFSFKQTVNFFQNMPVYYLLVRDRIFHGKLKETTRDKIQQPTIDVTNMEYDEVSRRSMKNLLQGWLVERYLDIVELIWPYYCRTIRFLKRASLI